MTRQGRLSQFVRDNGLFLVLLALFLVTFAGQIATGKIEHDASLRDLGLAPLSLWGYLDSGHFLEVTGATWASEFLQIAIFVLLSARLYQKGSPEGLSEGKEIRDEDGDGVPDDPRVPWPVRRGGWVKWVYSHSLSLTFTVLFLVTLAMHAFGGAREYSAERRARGESSVTTLQFLGTSRFWFQSLQDWQSGFFSLATMVYFLIYLREKGSVVSKRLTAPNDADE